MANESNRDKSFFDDGFDDVTIAKLDIYESYLQAWLPVPLSGRMHVSEAVIYDLFCGPGVDSRGQEGSPLRARNVVAKNDELVLQSAVPVRLVFNDYLPEHIEKLKVALGSELQTNDGKRLAKLDFYAKPFEELFPQLIAEMNHRTANLLFIDQFGATEVDEEVFRQIHALKNTDVLFFVSSMWFRRFVGRPEAENWGITKDEIMNVQYSEVHRFMTEHFCRLVGDEYFVAPFSLKKGSNIYGLVFASHNHLGLKKFLDVAWKHDPHSGESNFDMYNEGAGDRMQAVMFEARKITEFQADLRKRILAREFDSDRSIYFHMLQSGFTNKHARRVVSKLAAKKDGVIEFQENGVRQRPRLSPDSVKDPRSLVFVE